MMQYTVAAPDPNFHVYLMIGQSNMAGAGTIEAQDRVAHPKVQVMQDISCSSIPTPYGQWRPATPPLIYCSGGLGPGDYFGRGMGDAAPSGVTIGLVGAAYPGASITWVPAEVWVSSRSSRKFLTISPSADL